MWGAGYAVATEISKTALNLVLERYLNQFRAQNQHLVAKSFGWLGSVNVELQRVGILELEDPPPIGTVLADAEAGFRIDLRLLFFKTRVDAQLRILDVGVDVSRTPAGLPRGVVVAITPSLGVAIDIAGGGFLLGWFLRRVAGPLIEIGIWLAFRVLRRVELPVWELADIFGGLGLRFAAGSPLLTAQKNVLPSSLLLASDFNLANATLGSPGQVAHFLPPSTNAGVVVHQRSVAAAVRVAIGKGWLPTKFRVKKWKIYINAIAVRFESGTIVATGRLTAKRGGCWCRVKAKIKFRAAIVPELVDTNTAQPAVSFRYDADVNAKISTSGMLVVLGTIMFGPVFMALTLAASFLINLLLDQFLPFTTSFASAGNSMTVTAKSANVAGFAPFSMRFALELSGKGRYDLSRFTQFPLPAGPSISLGFTNQSLSLQPKELRLAANLS